MSGREHSPGPPEVQLADLIVDLAKKIKSLAADRDELLAALKRRCGACARCHGGLSANCDYCIADRALVRRIEGEEK